MEGGNKRYTPKEVSELLEIHSTTLRKYSEALEKEGYSFTRNERNHREYADHDLTVLRKTIEIKADMEITIKSAVQQVVMWSNGMELLPEKRQQDYQPEIVNTSSGMNRYEDDDFTTTPLQARLLMQLQDQIEVQKELIEKQSELLEKVWEDLAITKEQNSKLIEEQGIKQIDPMEEERIRRKTEEMNENIRYIRERMEAKQEIAMTINKRKWQFWKK